MVEKNNILFHFRLNKIEDVSFSLRTVEEMEISVDTILISYGWATKSITEKNTIILTLKVLFHTKIEEKQIDLLDYTNQSYYEIKNFNDVVTVVDGNKLNIHSGVIKQFLSMSISTTRGILYERLGRTKYSKVLLPAVTSAMLDEIIKVGTDK